jgi:hypothetical protein
MAKGAILLLMLAGLCSPVSAESMGLPTIRVEIDTPSSAWVLELKSLHLKEGQLLVVGELILLNDNSLPRISKAADQVPVAEKWSKLPRRLLITGRTWKESFFTGSDWKREDVYTAVTRAQLKKALEGSHEIYTRPRPWGAAPGFVGLTREQATELAEQRGFSCVFANDPRVPPVTANIDPKRITLHISGGKVVKATRG